MKKINADGQEFRNLFAFKPRRRRRVQFATSGEKRVEEYHAESLDINRIVKLAERTGFLPSKPGLMDGDFSNVPDYQDALNIVLEARERFSRIPARVRARFDNDPALFLSFCSDPSNREEMVELGLVDKKSSSKAPLKEAPAPSEKESVPAEGGGPGA